MLRYRIIHFIRTYSHIAGLLLILSLDCNRSDTGSQSGKPQTLQRKDPWSALTYAQRRGKAHYEQFCIHCHGTAGHGDGANAYALDTLPRQFSQAGLFDVKPDSFICAVIESGGRAEGLSHAMPGFGGSMQQRQIRQVLSYLKTLSRPQEDFANVNR